MTTKLKSIAVLMCCFNRKEKTLKCLEILKQQKVDGATLEVFLVDDGSSDGTYEAVKSIHPEVNLIKGSGHLYWSGGMRLAFEHSKKSDYYLWLNDDTDLYPNTLKDFLELNDSFQEDVIVTGAILSINTGKVAYGGMKRSSTNRLRFSILEPFEEIADCDAMNGNCVLIPASVYERLGNIDPFFQHAHGDIDFGLRAKREGFRIILSKDYAGKTETKFLEQRVYLEGRGIKERIQLALSMKALSPKEWWLLCWRHSKKNILLSFFSPYLRVLLGRPVRFVQRPK